jgi:5-methylcytosine-specific restriction endonuclease McrA
MHKNYKFSKIKNIILFFYDYECFLCMVKKIDNHVHHCDGNHFNNDVENLIVLCENCHKIAHKSKMVLVNTKTKFKFIDLSFLNDLF